MSVLLITGAARRVGEIVVRDFARRGWDVAFTCNQSVDNAKKLVNELSEDVKIKFYQGDFCDSVFAKGLIKQVKADFKQIDVVINNASIFERRSFTELTEKELDANFSVHVKTPLILGQQYAKLIGTGKIINITDVMVGKNATQFFPYILTKKSLSELTRMMAKNLAPKIQVNEICPGMMLDDINLENIPHSQDRVRRLPAGVNPSTDQLLRAINYLVRNDCYGERLFVAGGEQII